MKISIDNNKQLVFDSKRECKNYIKSDIKEKENKYFKALYQYAEGNFFKYMKRCIKGMPKKIFNALKWFLFKR